MRVRHKNILKFDVQDCCEQGDTCVDNSTIDDMVTDMTKFDFQDSCAQGDACVDNSTVGDKVTDVIKSDIQGSCQQSDTCVDNVGVVDKMTDMTKSDVHDTCVNNPSVDDNEPYTRHIYISGGHLAGRWQARRDRFMSIVIKLGSNNTVKFHLSSI